MGAIVGELLPTHPVLAFFVAIVVHFAADMVPHGDTDLYKGYISGSKMKRALAFVGIDAAVAVILTVLLFAWRGVSSELSVTLGIIGGVLPDLLVAVYEVMRVRSLRWFHRVHFFFHNLISGRTGDLSLAAGLCVEFSVLAALVYKLA